MEDNYNGSFSQGRTMRAGSSTAALVFAGQKVLKEYGTTSLKHPSGLRCEHHLSWLGNVPVFSSRVTVRNAGKQPVTLEMLSSFSLGGMTPYLVIDAGWYQAEGTNWSSGHGDWEVSSRLFPNGLAAAMAWSSPAISSAAASGITSPLIRNSND